MFQLPMLGSGMPGLLQGSGPDAAGGASGLNGMMQGAEGLMSGFSGELQAMLMQMSPQMLQQLEDLLAGGMALPQAARSLLAEAGVDGMGDLLGNLLEEGLPVLEEQSQLGPMLQRTMQENGLTKLAGDLQAGSVGINLSGLNEAISASMGGTMSTPGLNSANATLSPQLASSLLDMGVPQQVGGKGWSGAITDRISWMVQGEQQFAKLQLNPPHLGPLEVRVSLQQDQASVSFLAQHAAVREAIEAALPRLREMFDQQSMELVRADVSDPGAQQGDQAGDSSSMPGSQPGLWGGDEDESVAEPDAQLSGGVADNLVDMFV